MELASEGMSLLALPQTDSSEEARILPRGPSRSDTFATTAETYFKTLNVCLFVDVFSSTNLFMCATSNANANATLRLLLPDAILGCSLARQTNKRT